MADILSSRPWLSCPCTRQPLTSSALSSLFSPIAPSFQFPSTSSLPARPACATSASTSESTSASTPSSMSSSTSDKSSSRRKQRVEKAREERDRKKEAQPKGYPNWARVLEKGAKEDEELREILGNSLGNPEEMLHKIEERLGRKAPEMFQPKKGSATPMDVHFKEFEPSDVYIWIDLYSSPTEENVELIGSVIRSWYVIGHLGAFNSSCLQLSRLPPEASYTWKTEGNGRREGEGEGDGEGGALPSFLHNTGDLEFQDHVGRIWVDLGTTDSLALDLLLNSFQTLSSDYVGIKRITIGGEKYGEWEEGMTNEEAGYILHKI